MAHVFCVPNIHIKNIYLYHKNEKIRDFLFCSTTNNVGPTTANKQMPANNSQQQPTADEVKYKRMKRYY